MALALYEAASPFLSLPPESRLQVYSYLIPKKTLEVDLCTPRRPTDGPLRRRGVISSLVNQVLALDMITRSNGLHLLLVSRRTRAEVLPLLSRLVVRFHCPRCFDELLRNLSYGLGVGVRWMKHVEIEFNCAAEVVGPPYRRVTASLARFMVTETMYAAQRTACLYYGRLDLMRRDKWEFEPLTEDATPGTAAAVSTVTGATLLQNQNSTLFNPANPTPAAAPQAAHADGHPKWLISAWFYF